MASISRDYSQGFDSSFYDESKDELISKLIEMSEKWEVIVKVDKAEEEKENITGPSFLGRHM